MRIGNVFISFNIRFCLFWILCILANCLISASECTGCPLNIYTIVFQIRVDDCCPYRKWDHQLVTWGGGCWTFTAIACSTSTGSTTANTAMSREWSSPTYRIWSTKTFSAKWDENFRRNGDEHRSIDCDKVTTCSSPSPTFTTWWARPATSTPSSSSRSSIPTTPTLGPTERSERSWLESTTFRWPWTTSSRSKSWSSIARLI